MHVRHTDRITTTILLEICFFEPSGILTVPHVQLQALKQLRLWPSADTSGKPFESHKHVHMDALSSASEWQSHDLEQLAGEYICFPCNEEHLHFHLFGPVSEGSSQNEC